MRISAFPSSALDTTCFTLPLLRPGDLDGAIPSSDSETNFIGPWSAQYFRSTLAAARTFLW